MVHKPLKIFLGDLTYTTISLATDAFPLNVGYIASYCKSKFGNDVEIQVFKYIDDLDNALNSSPPDVLGLSNYAWNHNVSYEFFKLFKKLNSNGVTVWGGPNFPNDIESQTKFMNEFTDVDFYVPGEGEIGFSNIIKQLFETNYRIGEKRDLFSTHIEGCISKTLKNIIHYEPLSRTRLLDEVPSPYTSGFLDKFFDGKLSPMLQTNRGCPFACTFCTDGSSAVNQVNSFSLDRVKDELKYIGAHIPKNTHNMIISDLNFGMMPRDLEVCDLIAEIQQEYNYPQQIHATTGKNQKKRVIEAVKRNNGALRIYMSVQSMDEQVLKNIRRENISTDVMLGLMPAVREAGLLTESEVILGLPGETYQTHLDTIRKLIHAKLDSIQVYTCMLLDGSEMATPHERSKWGFKTKFRVLPSDFSKMSNGKNILEIEEVIVGNNTLTFDEYVELRVFAFVLWTSTFGIIYAPILKFLRHNNIDAFNLFFQMMKQVHTLPLNIKNIFDSFKEKTIGELWDSKEEIISNYQDEGEFQKLLNGEDAMNVIQYHNFLLRKSHMDELTEYLFKIAYSLLDENNINEELKKQFYEIKNYCLGLGHNVISKNRDLTNLKFIFSYDIQAWLDSSDKLLEIFKLVNPITLEFRFYDEQSTIFQDELDRADSLIGQSQALKKIPVPMQWRHPELI